MHFSPKLWDPHKSLKGVTTQNSTIWIYASMKISNIVFISQFNFWSGSGILFYITESVRFVFMKFHAYIKQKNSKACLWNSAIVWNKKRSSYLWFYKTGILSLRFTKLSTFVDPVLLKSCLYTSIFLWSLNVNKFVRKISWPYRTRNLDEFL